MSGKIRIQRRPVLPIERDRTFLAASIWLERIRAAVRALSPYEPKATVTPRVATPTFRGFLLIVCHLRYLTFLGNNILFKNIALIDPDFNSNGAIRHNRFSKRVVNIGAQSLKRNQTKFAIFCATHSGATKTTG